MQNEICKTQAPTLTDDEDFGIIKHVGEDHKSSCAAKSVVCEVLAN